MKNTLKREEQPKLQYQMHHKFIILIVGAFLLVMPLISAAQPVPQVFAFTEGFTIQYPQISTLKQNQDYTFEFHVFNKSNGFPINKGISCYFELYNNTGDHQMFANVSVVTHTWDYEVIIEDGNFSRLGIYSYIFQCNNSVMGSEPSSLLFEVTSTGELKPSEMEILIISILFILVLSFMLFTFIWNFEHLVTGDTSIKDVGISISYYFTLLSFSLLNKLFFASSEIGSWTDSMLAWTSFSHIILPVFGFAWNFFFGMIAKSRRNTR